MGQNLGNPIDVIYKQSIQGPKDWANLMVIARKQIVRLRIRPRRFVFSITWLRFNIRILHIAILALIGFHSPAYVWQTQEWSTA